MQERKIQIRKLICKSTHAISNWVTTVFAHTIVISYKQVQYLFLTLIYIPYGLRSVILKTILIKMAQPNKNLYLPGIKSPFINPKMYLVIVMMSMLYVGVQQHNDVNKYDNILPNFH